jgi:hypothetical protein
VKSNTNFGVLFQKFGVGFGVRFQTVCHGAQFKNRR